MVSSKLQVYKCYFKFNFKDYRIQERRKIHSRQKKNAVEIPHGQDFKIEIADLYLFYFRAL
jgi:hypothetical protein